MSVTTQDRIRIEHNLEVCLETAISSSALNIPLNVEADLVHIFNNIDVATSGYLNLLTCLICTSIDTTIDPRFHRKPGRGMPAPENTDGWFSGRVISEKILYPWLEIRGYRTAKSGWQTRTYERPKPYTLDYPENISYIKSSFLNILHYASQNPESCIELISYLLRKEIIYINNKNSLRDSVSKNKIGNEVLIIDIVSMLEQHFQSPNSSHLPVIAIYSIYQLLIDEVDFYNNLHLKELGIHEAADLRTGSIGDIELEDSDGDIIEGLEIKHGIEIDLPIILRAKEKILRSKTKRYYILTTHRNCGVISDPVLQVTRQIYDSHGAQVIINGVLPTIKYYLRMCQNPSGFINNYSSNLAEQKNVTTEQLEYWEHLLSNI